MTSTSCTVRAVALAVSLGTFACTRFDGSDVPSEPVASGEQDGGATTLGTSSDGGVRDDAGGDVPPTAREDFESGASCLPWTAIRGALATTEGGAGATARSCQACTTEAGGGGAHRTLRPALATAFPAGTYTFTVSVRSAHAGKVAFEVYGVEADGSRGAYVEGALTTLSPEWKTAQVSVTTAVRVPGFWLDLYQSRDNGDTTDLTGTCFQFDEYSVEYLADR